MKKTEQCSDNELLLLKEIIMSKAEGLKMVETAVDLLFRLTNNTHGMGPREISRTFDISTTAAQRLVTSLEKKNCLQFDPVSQKYKLGYGLIRFVHGSVAKYDLVKIAQSYMAKLRDITGETICLNTMVDHKRITIFQEESTHELRWVAQIGHVYPLYIGASGKVILANLSEEKIKEVLSEQQKEEPSDWKTLVSELDTIKTKGYVVSFGERISGGVGIAVPLLIKNHHASISIYAPANRVTEQNIEEYVNYLKDAANEIEQRFKEKIYI
jgi:DNA-binding IclR family transcriptional regulator